MKYAERTIDILGVRIDDVTLAETLSHVQHMLQGSAFHQIVTVNPEFIMRAQRDPTFRAVLADSALATPDGTGIMLAARWKRYHLRERVTGVALTKHLVQAGHRVFLLGSAPGVAEQAANVLRATYPQANIVGTWAGSPQPHEAQAIIERINQAQAEIVLVAYGAPAQDRWLHTYGTHLQAKVGIGIGGTLDYLAGVQPYAPAFLRRYGLEWLYRLITQPQRWRRVWTAVVEFSWAAWRDARKTRAT